jgi:hypothetical protein
MSSFDEIKKIQAQKQQDALRQQEEQRREQKRSETESRENRYRYNQVQESLEQARQSFLMAQSSQQKFIGDRFLSLVPEILDEFGKLIFGTDIKKEPGLFWTKRQVICKKYSICQLDEGPYFVLTKTGWKSNKFILTDTKVWINGYCIELMTEYKLFEEQYWQVNNGNKKILTSKLGTHFFVEYCKIYYFSKTAELSYNRVDDLGNRYPDPEFPEYVYHTNEYHTKNMINLQKLDIEKALTEVWKAQTP